MALGSTTCRQQYGVGRGGNGNGGDRTRGAGETGNGHITVTGEVGESSEGKEAKGGGGGKGDRWWGAIRRTIGSTKAEVPIRFGTYNIRNNRSRGLESALRGMAQANIDLGVFQETKCTDGIYTHDFSGYRVVAIETLIQHRGEVALFYRPSPLFAVEAVREYRPNVFSFKVTTGGRRWYIIGCYLSPDDAWTIQRVVTAMGDQPIGTSLLVAGDLNTYLGATDNDRWGSEISALMTEAGVEDMSAHFLPRKQPWGKELRTWSMVREGRVV